MPHRREEGVLQLVVGLCELVMSMLVAVLSTWVAVRGMVAATRGLDEHSEVREGNVAVGVVVAAAFLSAAAVAHDGVRPLMASLDVTLRVDLTSRGLGRWALAAFGVGLLDILLALLANALGWSLARVLIARDPLDQLRQRNLAVGIALASLLVVCGFLIAQGQATLVEAILPHPNSATIRLWEP